MKRDFHFQHENSIPVFKKKKPKNPAPPMNAKRNPSTAIQDHSEYDEVQPERKPDREEPVYINDEPESFSDNDIKVYEPKRSKKKTSAKPGSKQETNRFLLAAAVMGAVGVMLLIVGVVIAVNYYNMYY